MAELRLIEAICAALHEEMERDPNVVLLGEDVGVKGGVFGASKGLLERFGPLRVLDTPVSEIAIAGASIGAAMMGLRPVAEFQFADYMHPAYDQIVNQAATMRWRSVGGFGVPAVFRAPFGGGVKGGVYHSQSMEAAYCHVPGLKVVVPATPADGKGLLKAAIRDDDPVVFFEPKRAYRLAPEPVGGPDDLIPLGVARVDRQGTALSIVTYGIGVHVARDAASTLAADGIDVEIIDLRTLVPMDRGRGCDVSGQDRTSARAPRGEQDHGLRRGDRSVRGRGALLRPRCANRPRRRRRLPPSLQRPGGGRDHPDAERCRLRCSASLAAR